ncbi:MAG: hypothetical protein E7340_05445 [Clostridiales bacterium]|nr:hypothetical protein [Clostridiales bacterium]MBE5754753.1 hypothetical protein [Clostridiales bacterium]
MYIYSYENLSKMSQTEKGKKYIEKFKTYYQDNIKDKPINNLSFSNYKLFFSAGDRKTFETQFFGKRARLTVLQVLAISDDKYIEELEEIIASICDEFTWIVPAHAYLKLELFSTETARMLAETLYVFGDKLSRIIQDRVRESVFNKVIQVYENNSFWWDSTDCNWAAVCGCGVGLAYLYLFPERFESVKDRLFNTFKSFLSGFDEEGYCYEGVNYWQYGFTAFCAFFEIYEKLCNIRPDFIDSEKVKNVICYVENAKMSEDIYLPYADGGYPTWNMDANSAYTIKLLYVNDFAFNKVSEFLPSHAGLGLRGLVGTVTFDKPEKNLFKESSIYYKKAEVFIRKRKKYSFTTHGGNNGIIHNHNDVGAFQIVKNNERIICDFGAGLYTKEYFGIDEQRYKIFACNSLSHSVPIVDGELQMYGSQYKGEILNQSENSIVIDIAKAYANNPKNIIVEYQTEEDCIFVKYKCKGIKEKITFHFVSDIEPTVKESCVCIKDVRLLCNLPIKPEISHRKERPHNPARKETDNIRDVYLIDYEVFTNNEIIAEFTFQL